MSVVILHNELYPDSRDDQVDVLVQIEVVTAALQRLGHRVATCACSLDLSRAEQELLRLRPAFVFNLVESLGSSDWLALAATGLLEALHIPFTGSDTAALVATNDKVRAKQRLRAAGLPTADWYGAPRTQPFPGPGKYLCKPIREHASLGIEADFVQHIDDEAQLHALWQAANARIGKPCFAERFIPGREFNLSLLAGPRGFDVLPPAEIDFSRFPPGTPHVVGYRAKWHPDSWEFQLTPRTFALADADRDLQTTLIALTRQTAELFQIGGYARVDFRVDEAGQPWILEVNANPCLSPDAGFAGALAQAGISFDDAIQRIIQTVE